MRVTQYFCAFANDFFHWQVVFPMEVIEAFYCASSAATPGKVLPSIHSRKAPPAVET